MEHAEAAHAERERAEAEYTEVTRVRDASPWRIPRMGPPTTARAEEPHAGAEEQPPKLKR
ncbi:hypothetical protein GCM10009702_02060 [Propioniferax innocua]